MQRILESPLARYPRPWWQPVLSLGLTLYGILVLDWHLPPIIFLFWWEVILIVATALVRMLGALDSRPFWQLLGLKIGLLAGGVVLGGAMILLSVVFTQRGFSTAGKTEGLAVVPAQMQLLTLGYLAGLVVHFFANGRYKTAQPMAELGRTLVHLLVLLALLQAVTMHLLPKYPQLEQATWVAVAVVGIKFVVDAVFVRLEGPFRQALQETPDV